MSGWKTSACIQCSGDPRDFHAFPTRRSSDLKHVDFAAKPNVAVKHGPTCRVVVAQRLAMIGQRVVDVRAGKGPFNRALQPFTDRKSTRLNSSNGYTAYAVSRLKTNTGPHQTK